MDQQQAFHFSVELSVLKVLLVQVVLITRPGQGRGFAVYIGDPTGNGLNPLTVIGAAHIGLVDERSGRQAGPSGAVEIGLLHLGKASGSLTEHEHDLCHPLVSGKAKGHR